MLDGLVPYLLAFTGALVVSTVASPAGVSGAVFLLPFQVSVLGTPSPSVTPTNLLYNVVATPGALYRYWRQGQTGGRLTRLLIAGTLPGVVAAWDVGIALGAGGLIGGYLGAFAQPHFPETLVRRVLGLIAIAVSIRYAWLADHLSFAVPKWRARRVGWPR